MKETNYDNQAPIFRFLKKHKWRIILPSLLLLLYSNHQGFFKPQEYTQYSADLFVISPKLNKTQLIEKAESIKNKILSDENLKNLIMKYDLLAEERSQNLDKQLLRTRLKNGITLYPKTNSLSNGISISVWIYFKQTNTEKIKILSDEIIGLYEANSDLQIEKVGQPVPTTTRHDFVWMVLVFQLLLSFFFFSIPLIIIWEIPNLFYSPKTKENVFNPIESDWQNELYEAKLRGENLKAFQTNLRYSFAFLSAMIQKSPIGDLIEFVKKIAK